jgi:hypothetical protein
VSIFLDNYPGSLFEVMSELDKNKIRVFALSIADAGEFGLVRLIAEEPVKASKLLEGKGFSLAKSKKNTEVLAIFISEENNLSMVTKILGDGGVNIEYAYSSAVYVDGRVVLILRPSNVEMSEHLLIDSGVVVVSLGEIKKCFQ